MAPYLYQPITDEGPLCPTDTIRLVAILAGPREDPEIRCNVIRHSLSEPAESYEALSYTWGDASDRAIILCGAPPAELEVTRNCYNALHQLRREDAIRIMWIDAICINQNDISERTAQVRIMGRIFASADRVVAYLGEETPGSRLLFEELSQIERSYRSSGSWWERGPPSAEIARELDNLISRSYFTRIWVIQEVRKAKGVVFMCGPACASLTALYTCISGHRHRRVTTKVCPYVILSGMTGRYASTVSIDSADAALPVTIYSTDAAGTLWKLLLQTRQCISTDPRDKVFALKALLPSGGQELGKFVDYHRSVELVFTEIAEFLLPCVKLSLLSAIRHPHVGRSNLPSWVPNWSRNFHSNAVWDVEEDEPWVEDEIDNVIDTGCAGHFKGHNSVAHPEFTILDLRCSCLWCRSSHRVLCVKGIQCGYVKTIGSPIDIENRDGICGATIARLIQSKGVEASNGRDIPQSDQIPTPILDSMRLLNALKFDELLSRGLGSVYDSDEVWCGGIIGDKMLHKVKMALEGCRFFVDEIGQVGIAPSETREGDVICVLKGVASPCLLRPREGGGWTLISGECYLQRKVYNPFPAKFPYTDALKLGEEENSQIW